VRFLISSSGSHQSDDLDRVVSGPPYPHTLTPEEPPLDSPSSPQSPEARRSVADRSSIASAPPNRELVSVESMLEKLKPKPGRGYRSNRRLCQELHFAIEQRDRQAVLNSLLRRTDPNILQPGSTVSPLRRAFNVQSSTIVRFLAVAGADLDEPMDDGATALIKGVKCEFTDRFIYALCELGARVEAVDDSGLSALHHASASKKEDDTIKVLLGAGADVNSTDYNGRAPLHIAVENGRCKSAADLLEYGADVETRLPDGRTALHVAIAARNKRIVQLLANNGANLDGLIGEHTPLTLAISIACSDIALALIEAGASINLKSTTGNFPLLAAVAGRDEKVVDSLLMRSPDMSMASARGYFPIHMAAQKNQLAMVQSLVASGSPIDPETKKKETPLSIAVVSGQYEITEYLIRAGANVDYSPQKGENLLSASMRSGHVQITRALIQMAASVSRPLTSSNSMTAIHLAAKLGLESTISDMVAVGADMETRLWSGYTPLFIAVQAGNLGMVRHLRKHGGNIQSLSRSRDSLLFVGTADVAMTKYLIEAGLDVNHRNEKGATALHYAALNGHMAVAKLLLQKGAKNFHANAVFESLEAYRDGQLYRQGTPAGIATQRGHKQVADLVEKWKFKT
jgi:ankyrin repeat protein